MRIELEIPKEFEKDYIGDKFKDFFSRVLVDIDRKGTCGLYEEETAEMFVYAFDKSKLAYNIDKVVEELEEQKNMIALGGSDSYWYKDAINIVKRGGVNERKR